MKRLRVCNERHLSTEIEACVDQDEDLPIDIFALSYKLAEPATVLVDHNGTAYDLKCGSGKNDVWGRNEFVGLVEGPNESPGAAALVARALLSTPKRFVILTQRGDGKACDDARLLARVAVCFVKSSSPHVAKTLKVTLPKAVWMRDFLKRVEHLKTRPAMKRVTIDHYDEALWNAL
jgi:hypothetical protein